MPDQKALRFYLQSEPMSMDPGKGGNRISQVVLRELFEGLMRIDGDGRPSFAAANSVEVSEDKLTYCFHLRPTLWSNGMPVTAHDFEYAWKRMITPSFPTTFSYAFYCIKNARKAHLGQAQVSDVGIRAQDDYTLLVTLEHPAPYFIELTSNPIYSPICKSIAEKNPNWNNAAGTDFVSNGPFVLADWRHRSEIVLAKNENYWDAGSVAVERMTFPIIENPQTALNMYECGELDWVGDPFGDIPLDAIPKLKAENKLLLRHLGSANWLEVNVHHPILSSNKIRLALAMAVNRQDLADHLLQGGEKPAYTLLPETLTLLQHPTFKDNDLDKAKVLFTEGLQDVGLTYENLPPITFCHTSEPMEKALAEAIQQQWEKALGLRVLLSPSDRNTHWSRVSKGDFDIAGMRWFTFYHDPIYNLELMKYSSKGSHNYNGTHWEHPHYTKLLDESDTETNLAARDDILREAEEFLMKEMPVIPICYNTSKFVKNPIVFGESLSPIGMIELKNVNLEASTMYLDK
jgi:oligopeptide transport system substrate-binding protein